MRWPSSKKVIFWCAFGLVFVLLLMVCRVYIIQKEMVKKFSHVKYGRHIEKRYKEASLLSPPTYGHLASQGQMTSTNVMNLVQHLGNYNNTNTRADIKDLLAMLNKKHIGAIIVLKSGKTNLEEHLLDMIEEQAPRICLYCAKRSDTKRSKLDKEDRNTSLSITQSSISHFQVDSSSLRLTVLTDSKMLSTFYFKPRSKILHQLSHQFSHVDPSVCALPGGQRPFLLVLVPSEKNNVKGRNAVRETWGSLAYNHGKWGGAVVDESMRLLFVMGKASYNTDDVEKLSEEAHKHGDLLLIDFHDSYKNLSLKIVSGLAWVDRHCHGVGHVLKADEDTFVHIPKLINLLKIVEKLHSSFVLGYRHVERHPRVTRSGRWAIGSEYPMSAYPAYVYGHSYVISGPAVRTIVQTFTRMPLVANEDAYITGILSKAGKVTRLGSTLFAVRFHLAAICQMSSGELVSLTDCCPQHLQDIYVDVTAGFCDSRLQLLVEVPGCRLSRLMKQ